MHFGLFYEAPEEPGQTHAERYAEMLDLIAFGDARECIDSVGAPTARAFPTTHSAEINRLPPTSIPRRPPCGAAPVPAGCPCARWRL